MRWMLLLCGLLAAVDAADAQTMTNTPVFPQTPTRGLAQVLNATGAITIANNAASVSNSVTAYTCKTSAGQATKIKGIIAGSTDGTARDLLVVLVNASKVYVLGTVTIPINAGNVAGTPHVNIMSPSNMPGLPIDSDGNPFIQCASGDTIAVGVKTTAVTANAAITVLVEADDY